MEVRVSANILGIKVTLGSRVGHSQGCGGRRGLGYQDIEPCFLDVCDGVLVFSDTVTAVFRTTGTIYIL